MGLYGKAILNGYGIYPYSCERSLIRTFWNWILRRVASRLEGGQGGLEGGMSLRCAAYIIQIDDIQSPHFRLDITTPTSTATITTITT